MAQLSSTSRKEVSPPADTHVSIPKKSFSMEFFVGLFMIASLAAAAYLAVGLGGLALGGNSHYTIKAEFDNISGLKYGAPVEIAGVPVGEVSGIELDKNVAMVSMRIRNGVKIGQDDIASVRTQGIIGDRYVKIARGASENFLEAGGVILETESVVDLEDVIGKVIHSLEGGSDKGTETEK